MVLGKNYENRTEEQRNALRQAEFVNEVIEMVQELP